MKTKMIFLSALAAIAISMSSCGSKEASEVCDVRSMCVDTLMAKAPVIVGDTIEVRGVVSHLCKHGGRKAFLMSPDSTLVRCEATAVMGGAFAPDCVGKDVRVKGIVRENRIGEAEVVEMEARYAAADSAAQAHETCDTEKKAQGQQDLATFEARMADYRAKIAARAEAEGKDYLSFYYVEALSYVVDSPKDATK